MNSILTITKNFLICSFAVFLLHYLIPKGNIKKTVSVVLIVFTLSSIIIPIKSINGLNLQINDSFNSFSENSLSAVKTNIRLMTDSSLREIGIDNYELEIDLEEDNDNYILTRYVIYIEDVSQKDKIADYITSKTGLIPQIELLQ